MTTIGNGIIEEFFTNEFGNLNLNDDKHMIFLEVIFIMMKMTCQFPEITEILEIKKINIDLNLLKR
jgi:hypothetical protein